MSLTFKQGLEIGMLVINTSYYSINGYRWFLGFHSSYSDLPADIEIQVLPYFLQYWIWILNIMKPVVNLQTFGCFFKLLQATISWNSVIVFQIGCLPAFINLSMYEDVLRILALLITIACYKDDKNNTPNDSFDPNQSIPDSLLASSEEESYSEDSEDSHFFDDALNHWVWLNQYGFTMNAGPHTSNTEFLNTIVQYEHLPDEIFANLIPRFYPAIPPYYDRLQNLVLLYRTNRRAFEEEIDRLSELL